MFINISLIIISCILISFFFLRQKGRKVEQLHPSMSNALKGICAICILMGHIDSPMSVFFHQISGPIVGLFFAMSGYGLTRQYQIKGISYIDTIPRKILKLIIPYIFCCFLYLLFEYIFIGQISFDELTKQLMRGHFSYCLPFSWFVTAIVYFYINYYVAFKIRYKELILWGGFVIWFLYTNYILPGDNGFMWGTSASFALSVTYTLHQKHFNKYIAILIFMIIVLSPLASVQSTLATLLVLLCFGGIQSKNQILAILGKISYEVYILQGVILVLLKNNYYVIPDRYCWVIWLLLTIFASYLYHKFIANFVYKYL